MSTTTLEVFQSYIDCRQNKRSTPSALAFQSSLAANIRELTHELNSGTYEIGQSRCFVVMTPKPREVWAASFRDRIVHHLIYNRIQENFTKSFSAGSCACILGRGTLYGSKRLERMIRSGSENWSKRLYYLKMDISNFFVSIQKDILEAQLIKRIQCDWTRALTLQVLHHDPTSNYVISGNAANLAYVPAHKSLFNAPPFMGLPIGNLSSQFFANVYMNVIDQFVEHKIRPRGYVRYVDDFILVDRDIELLKAAKDEIEQHLWQELNLVANPTKTELNTVYSGVDFVGRIIKPHRTIPRATLSKNAYQKLRRGEATAEGLTSTLGLLRQSKSFYIRKNLCRQALRHGFSVDWHGTKVMEVRKR